MQDTLILRPRNSGRFSTLMELYEKNYMLVRLLIPELRSMQGGLYLSEPDGLLPLELSNIEHSRYTTTFKLTYLFSVADQQSGEQASGPQSIRQPNRQPNRQPREPDLTVRLYHDARACEVMSGLIPSSRKDHRRTRDLMNGYHLNRFLQRWISYCLRQGHVFGSGRPVSHKLAEQTHDKAVADSQEEPGRRLTL